MAKEQSQNPVDRANDLLDEYESLRQDAVDQLLAEREALNEQLRRFGYSENCAEPEELKPGKIRRCGVCGGTGHQARTCKMKPPTDGRQASFLEAK